MKIFFKRILPCGLLLLLIFLILLMCAVPPVSRDALTHHLAIPKLYVLFGGIYELPDIIVSYYPGLLDLIYCIPMIFKNDIIPKYIHFLFALFTAILVYLYVQKRINRFYALLSILIFFSLPVIIKLSITVYVDLGLIFFSFAALLSLLKWYENDFRTKWLCLSAIFCGLALSTKYNGLLTLFLLTSFTPIIYLSKNKAKNSQLHAIWYGSLFLIISLLIFSPWMIRNYKWTKNPVYPLYKNFFAAPGKTLTNGADVSRIKKPSLNHFHVRKYVYKETGWQTILIPLRIFFQGEDDDPKYFDGRLNPLLFFLPFFAFLNFKSKNSQPNQFEKKILLSFSVLYILIVFFQVDMRTRWIGPAIPPLILLSSFGLKNLFATLKSNKFNNIINYNALSFVVTILLVSMFSLNFIYTYNLFKKIDPLPYIFNQVTRAQYIKKFRPEYSALQFANAHLNKNSKILALFIGGRRYYSNHYISFNRGLFMQIVKQANTEEEIFKELKKNGYTDLIINYSKMNDWINLEFKENKKKLSYIFLKNHADKIFSEDGHGLYHLR